MGIYKQYLKETYKPEEYDDWKEWVENEYPISKEDLTEFVNVSKIPFEWKITGKILRIENIWLDYDEKSETFDFLGNKESDIIDWVSNQQDYTKLSYMGLEEDDLYISGWECTIKDLSGYGGKVYHWTTEDAWEEIQKSGIMTPSSGTGLTNRFASGIFTSNDPEEYALGTYGNICLEIDLERFKNENNIPKLRLEPEPDILENSINSAMIHKLGIDYDFQDPSDMSTFTVIVGHKVPAKYIRAL